MRARTRHPLSTRSLLTGLAGLAGLAMVATLVTARPAAAAEQTTALVRIAHFVPDLSYVDVYAVSLDKTRLMPNVFYRDVSSYVRLPAGPFTYEVRSAGAPSSATPLVRAAGRLVAGRAYTAASVGRRGNLRGVLVADDLAPAAAGTAKVRVLNVADGLGPVQVDMTGTKARFSQARFAAPSGYQPVEAGRYRVLVRGPGGPVLLRGALAAKAGAVTTLALVGGAGRPRELVAVDDAMGMRRMPAGGIATGAGGTAPASFPAVPAALAVLGLLLAAVCGLAGRARVSARRAA
jgi:Domain of unknown function (DUF4397)